VACGDRDHVVAITATHGAGERNAQRTGACGNKGITRGNASITERKPPQFVVAMHIHTRLIQDKVWTSTRDHQVKRGGKLCQIGSIANPVGKWHIKRRTRLSRRKVFFRVQRQRRNIVACGQDDCCAIALMNVEIDDQNMCGIALGNQPQRGNRQVVEHAIARSGVGHGMVAAPGRVRRKPVLKRQFRGEPSAAGRQSGTARYLWRDRKPNPPRDLWVELRGQDSIDIIGIMRRLYPATRHRFGLIFAYCVAAPQRRHHLRIFAEPECPVADMGIIIRVMDDMKHVALAKPHDATLREAFCTMTNRPDVDMFLGMLNALPGPKMHEVSAVEARAAMAAMSPVAELPVGDLAIIRDVTIPGAAGPIPARLYDARETRGAGPVMVYYHGGGFVIGDLDTHGPYCAEAARALDIPVVSIDYRLAPENPWPAAPDDCEAAARWIATSPAELGLSVTGLVPAGDSAGGNLAIVTTMTLRNEPAAVPVVALFAIYPVVDDSNEWGSYAEHGQGKILTHEAMDYFMQAYQAERAHVRAAPLGHDHEGMPPTLVLTAGLDPLRDQGRAYAGELIAAGVPVVYREAKGNVHGFFNMRKAIPSSVADVAGAHTALTALIAEYS
jgi:acetyl esterase